MVAEVDTPRRRSRRQAGKSSGVEWAKEMKEEPVVNIPAPSMVCGPVPSDVDSAAYSDDSNLQEHAGSSIRKATAAADDASADKTKVDWTGGAASGTMEYFLSTYLCPLLLVLGAPVFAHVLTFITNNPSIKTADAFYNLCTETGVLSCVSEAMYFRTDLQPAFYFLLAFNGLALVLYYLPGEPQEGPITENGHTPKYTDNGMLHCVLFTLLFLVGSEEVYGGYYSLSVMYDTFPGCVLIFNVFALFFCLFLYIKGFYFPSTPDSGSSGHGILFDYYWGAELYPRIFGIDVKVFANCRFSMTYWMLSGISFAAASYKEHGSLDPGLCLSALSMLLYLYKFFWWEIGYLRSIDIIVDRAGFYETWGVITWVPTVYTCHSRSTVLTPSGLDWPTAIAIFSLSMLGVLCNFLADDQRQKFRESNGTLDVWGKPPTYIKAQYQLRSADGTTETRTSLLLASGWWGVARHFQYFFELMAAWSWGLLAGGFLHNKLSLTYPVFLTILLIHRAHRDEMKCLAKYGDGYKEYMKMVPYKIIPGIY